jgi:hypothetical protein
LAWNSSPIIIWLAPIKHSAGGDADKVRKGAIVGAHKRVVREADELSGQRKLNAGHHFVISPALLLPLSRSLSAGMGHGAICAQPPLRPMAYKPVARGGTLKIQIQGNPDSR